MEPVLDFSPLEFDLMGQALEEARKAAGEEEVPTGALVADSSGQIWGRGHNQVVNLHDPSAHAEIQALRSAARALHNYRLTGLWLFSTLEPCPMCLGAAIHSRLARVYFGAPEPKWGAGGSIMDLAATPGFNHRVEIRGGLRAEESRSLMVDFFRIRRRQPFLNVF